MPRKRRKFSPQFKAKVGLEAITGLRTISEIAQEHKLHPNQVATWKRELTERLPDVFAVGGGGSAKDDQEELIEELYAKIGHLTVELEWLRKKSRALGL